MPEAKNDRVVVLHVEDDEPLRRGLASLMRLHGYEIVSAVDGLAALECMRQRGSVRTC